MDQYRHELKHFVDETARLDIFAIAGPEAYARSRLFMGEALRLVADELEEPFTKCLPAVLVAAGSKEASMEIEVARGVVEDLRREQRGFEGAESPYDRRDSGLYALFMYALQEWPAQPRGVHKASIMEAIDEFSATFIRWFGRSDELVRTLRAVFGV